MDLKAPDIPNLICWLPQTPDCVRTLTNCDNRTAKCSQNCDVLPVHADTIESIERQENGTQNPAANPVRATIVTVGKGNPGAVTGGGMHSSARSDIGPERGNPAARLAKFSH